MKKSAVLYLLPLAAIMASCSGEPERVAKGDVVYGGTLRYNETEKLLSLYPQDITDVVSWHAASQIYEGLVKFNPLTLEIEPAIAESFKNDNNTVYTFTIRKGVFFHDDECFEGGKGRELTADDVKYSFEQLCTNNGHNLNFGSTFKDRVKGATEYFNKTGALSGVEVSGNTVKVTLLKPMTSFLSILANPACSVIPKEAVSKYGDKMHVGTGPFRFLELNSDTTSLILVRNASYYGKDSLGNQLPYLDSVKISYNSNQDKEMEEWQKQNLDFVWSLPAHEAKKFITEHISEFQSTPPRYVTDNKGELSVQYYEFNITRKPFDDKRVRQAFSYAIDRKKIVQEVLDGQAYAEGTRGICPPVLAGYSSDSLNGYSFDAGKAKKLLADAGYPEGKGFPSVTLTINSGAGGSRNAIVAQEIINQLHQNLGVNINLSSVTFEQKQKAAQYGNADMLRGAWVADYPSPENFLSLFYGKSVPEDAAKPSYPNTTRYRNTSFDSLYEAGVNAASQADAYKNFLLAEKQMLEDAPVMVLWYDGTDKFMHPYVHNFHLNAMRYFDFSRVYMKKGDSKKDSTAKDEKH